LEVLAGGRAVEISRYGTSFAIIEPAAGIDTGVLAAYATSESDLGELTATIVNRGAPESFVAAAVAGQSCLLTKGRRVYGLIRAAKTSDFPVPSTFDQLRASQAKLDEFLAANPEATLAELADYGDVLDSDQLEILIP
jgi:hypothetical protein